MGSHPAYYPTWACRLIEHYEGWRYRRTHGFKADRSAALAAVRARQEAEACANWADGREPQEICPCGHYAASHSFDICMRCFLITDYAAEAVSSDDQPT